MTMKYGAPRSNTSHKWMVFIVPGITFGLLFAAVFLYGVISTLWPH